MGSFETTIEREVSLSALEQLAQTSAPEGELGLKDGGLLELEVTVEYDEGWSTPARVSGPPEDCYPAEGQDLEITSVLTSDGVEIAADLSSEELSALTSEAAEDQGAYDGAEDAAAEDAYDQYQEDSFDYDYYGM